MLPVFILVRILLKFLAVNQVDFYDMNKNRQLVFLSNFFMAIAAVRVFAFLSAAICFIFEQFPICQFSVIANFYGGSETEIGSKQCPEVLGSNRSLLFALSLMIASTGFQTYIICSFGSMIGSVKTQMFNKNYTSALESMSD